MQRVKRTTAVAVLPADPGGGTPGFFAAPNPGGGVSATVPGYEWYNNVQEELMAVIEGQSIAPSGSDRTQLRQAIGKMIQSAQRAVVIDGVTFNAGVVNGNAVCWDAGNTRFDKALANGGAAQACVGVADVTNSKLYAFGDAVLFAGLTAGARYYLSDTTAGAITTTPPNAQVVLVGVARNATELFVDIDAAVVSPAPAVQGAFRNLAISADGASASVAVSYDELILGDGAGTYAVERNVAGAITTTNTGAGGLDTGALATNTWYSIWRIGKADGTRAWLFSVSATAPTMPSGYTLKARIGWFRTDGSGSKYPLSFRQRGRRAQYVVAAGSNVAAVPLAASGVAGSTSTPTWVGVSLATFVPSTASAVEGAVNISAGASVTLMVAPNAAYGSVTSTNCPPVATNGENSGNSTPFNLVLESTSVYWACSGSNGALAIIGWEDNL